jgi:hypothetical protein
MRCEIVPSDCPTLHCVVVFPRPEGADTSGAGNVSAPRGRRSGRRGSGPRPGLFLAPVWTEIVENLLKTTKMIFFLQNQVRTFVFRYNEAEKIVFFEKKSDFQFSKFLVSKISNSERSKAEFWYFH